MPNIFLKIVFLSLGPIFALYPAGGDAQPPDIQVNDNKISIHVSDMPLRTILEKLAESGIIIYLDPEINPNITASFENRDLEAGLKSILKSVNHTFIWEPLEHAADTSSPQKFKLVKISIFRQGQKERMIPLRHQAKSDPSSQELETKIIVRDNKVFVPVILGYQGNEVKTTLVFDTGADSIVLHEDIADKLRIDRYFPSTGRGVGGILIDAKETKLNYVRVGPHKKTDLVAHIVAYRGPKIEHYNGLLGINFLKGLKYTIDFDKQVIRWYPN